MTAYQKDARERPYIEIKWFWNDYFFLQVK